MEVKAVRGMHDLYQPEIDHWIYVETRVKEVLRAHGYSEIRTPVVERDAVFTQTVGGETDIVEKQMYTLLGDGEEKFVLRPEGTSSFVRAVIEHGLHHSGKPGRYFYYLPMFRHERPQKGRLRQFHQFGAELINDPSPEADAEIIALLHHLYQSFGITEYEIRVNSVGCQDCRPKYKEILKDFLRPLLDQLCEECQKRFERAPMRILDCKNDRCAKLVANAPKMLDHLCGICKPHHDKLKKRLTALQIPFLEDPKIVRGLDYYLRTAFEFTSNLLGAQSALVGGGRYDGLSERFGEKPFPAVGFGLGMERLMMVLEEKKALPDINPGPVFFFAPLGERAFELLYPLAFSLRRQGIAVEMPHELRGLKNLLKHADRSGARFALMIGDSELDAGTALLKEMKKGIQDTLQLNGLELELKRRHQLAP